MNTTSPRQDCPTQLPDAPLPPKQESQRDFTAMADDLQKEFITMAAGLNGEFETGEGMTEIEGALFVREQVDKFFGHCIHEGPDAHIGISIPKGSAGVGSLNMAKRRIENDG